MVSDDRARRHGETPSERRWPTRRPARAAARSRRTYQWASLFQWSPPRSTSAKARHTSCANSRERRSSRRSEQQASRSRSVRRLSSCTGLRVVTTRWALPCFSTPRRHRCVMPCSEIEASTAGGRFTLRHAMEALRPRPCCSRRVPTPPTVTITVDRLGTTHRCTVTRGCRRC